MKKVLALVAVACFPLSAFIPPMASAQGIIEWPVEASLGDGWDMLTGQTRANCLETPVATDPIGGLDTQWFWQEVSDQQSLRESLQVSASASYWVGPTVTAKAEFARTRNIDRWSINYLARQVTRLPARVISNYTLTNKARELLASDPERFRGICGTHYIKGEIRGGEYYALLSLRQFREEARQSIAALMSASGPAYSGEIQGSSAIEQTEYASQITVEGQKSGGDGITALTPETLRTDFQHFRAQMQNTANTRSIEAVLAPYPEFDRADTRQRNLDDAARLYMWYLDKEANYTSLLRNPDMFFVSKKSIQDILPDVRSNVVSMRTQLYEQMKLCSHAKVQGEIQEHCNFSRYPVPPAGIIDMPKRYQASCLDRSIRIPTLRNFTGFVRTNADGSMGGGDVLDFATKISSVDRTTVLLSLHARAYETSFWPPTVFEQAVKDLPVWSAANTGCYLAQDVSLEEDFSNTRVGAPAGVHDYTRLYPGSAIIADVSCRTNKDREDDGYVGCSEINLKPIPITLRHIERRGAVPPNFRWPSWMPRDDLRFVELWEAEPELPDELFAVQSPAIEGTP